MVFSIGKLGVDVGVEEPGVQRVEKLLRCLNINSFNQITLKQIMLMNPPGGHIADTPITWAPRCPINSPLSAISNQHPQASWIGLPLYSSSENIEIL